ncbi:DUF4177 domain-containing protein [Aliiglaciecola sp.]|nr:DUF4177 domain-containing protein [Aliiglaciecola sp.]
MKLNVFMILLICLLTGCQSTTQKYVKWEYKVVQFPDLPKEAFSAGALGDALKNKSMIEKGILQEHGEQGWELIQLRGGVLVFKRPVL